MEITNCEIDKTNRINYSDIEILDTIFEKEFDRDDYLKIITKIYLVNYKNKKCIFKYSNCNILNEIYIFETLNKQGCKNILLYYGYVNNKNCIIGYIMEYIPSVTLRDYLYNKDDYLDKKWEVKCKKILLQIAEGIQDMHENGFYHNDLRTDNILFMEETCQIKIIDFGSAGSRKMNPWCGVLRYMAPETYNDIYDNLYDKYVIQKKIKHKDDFFPVFYDKNDVYGIGLIAWELFHYPKIPYEKYNDTQIEQHMLNNTLKIKIGNNVSIIYKLIIESCLKYDMFERITLKKLIKILKS